MEYAIVTTSSGRRFIHKLPKSVKPYLLKEIQKLRLNPQKGEQLGGEFRPLRSLHLIYRGTQYRVVYYLNNKGKEVVVHYINTRENFYKKLRRLNIKSALY
jgi:mRNA-degrading endonuclease RelE of RelBE toxin-antitoxin system